LIACGIDGMPQDLVFRHTQESRDVDNLQRLHLTIPFEHSGYGRWSKAEMASEIRLRGTDARQGLVEPGTVHNASLTIAIVDTATANA
jgi:hypothetical protein